MTQQQQLSHMKTGEIAQLARKSGVDNVEQMNKEQMIQAISQSPKQRGRGGGRERKPAPAGTKPQDWKNIPGNQT